MEPRISERWGCGPVIIRGSIRQGIVRRRLLIVINVVGGGGEEILLRYFLKSGSHGRLSRRALRLAHGAIISGNFCRQIVAGLIVSHESHIIRSYISNDPVSIQLQDEIILAQFKRRFVAVVVLIIQFLIHNRSRIVSVNDHIAKMILGIKVGVSKPLGLINVALICRHVFHALEVPHHVVEGNFLALHAGHELRLIVLGKRGQRLLRCHRQNCCIFTDLPIGRREMRSLRNLKKRLGFARQAGIFIQVDLPHPRRKVFFCHSLYIGLFQFRCCRYGGRDTQGSHQGQRKANARKTFHKSLLLLRSKIISYSIVLIRISFAQSTAVRQNRRRHFALIGIRF